MKIGIVSVTSQPCWGGAEIYLNRLNAFLNNCNDENMESWLITGVPEIEKYDNGSVNQIRLVMPQVEDAINTHGIKNGVDVLFDSEQTQLWLDKVEEKLSNLEPFDIGIIYLQTLFFNDVEEVLKRLRPYFKHLITTSFDIESKVIEKLISENKRTESLLETLDRVKDDVKENLSVSNDTHLMKSQNIPQIKNHLHISHFNRDVLKLLKPSDSNDYVFQPILHKKWLENIDYSNHYQLIKTKPEDYTIGVINPNSRKGNKIIAEIIAKTQYKFLILNGGWGAGDEFNNYLISEYNTNFSERVKILNYSRNIISFYDSIDAFLFPSWIEGYGQVAQESITRKKPVITTNYPSIQQATIGKGKYINIKDYHNIDVWLEAIEDVYDNQGYWHFECNDGALMILNRMQYQGNEFIQWLQQIGGQPEKLESNLRYNSLPLSE